MFCMKCGTQLPYDAVFCYKCGNRVAIPENQPFGGTPTEEVAAPAVELSNMSRLEKLQVRAKEGNVMAMMALADAYQNGKDCVADKQKATEWYQKAADLGDEDAKFALKRLTRKEIHVGDIVMLGEWHNEPIEWQVLDVKEGRALLLSKYALVCKQYHTSRADITWENCSLRKWLNGEFYSKALQSLPEGTVVESNVPAHYNPEYSTDPGNDTKDKVFLLSVKEVMQYLKTDEERIFWPKSWVKSEGAWVGDNGACDWWLRSPGCDANRAAYVDLDGFVISSGAIVRDDDTVVCPACWVNLESDAFNS